MITCLQAEESHPVVFAGCLRPSEVLPAGRWVSLWTVVQIYAHTLVEMLSDLRSLEQNVIDLNTETPRLDELNRTIEVLAGYCLALELSSAQKQLRNIGQRIKREFKLAEYQEMLAEFRRRIQEDLEDRLFFCVYDDGLLSRFFTRQTNEYFGESVLVIKHADELFDKEIANRFPATINDIEDACKCFVFDRFTACVFHLMRIVEVGVLKLAKLIDYQDPKPSWGTILDKVDKYALRTKYADLPPKIQPHVELLRSFLPHMQAVQRAWRNNVSHVEDRIIPASEKLTPEDAKEIMEATQSLMKHLAKELPQNI
jgi:hypothetical protein